MERMTNTLQAAWSEFIFVKEFLSNRGNHKLSTEVLPLTPSFDEKVVTGAMTFYSDNQRP